MALTFLGTGLEIKKYSNGSKVYKQSRFFVEGDSKSQETLKVIEWVPFIS